MQVSRNDHPALKFAKYSWNRGDGSITGTVAEAGRLARALWRNSEVQQRMRNNAQEIAAEVYNKFSVAVASAIMNYLHGFVNQPHNNMNANGQLLLGP